jgi:very-short-patch-repair endonuclease
MTLYLKVRELARQMRKYPTQAEEFFWQKARNRRLFGLKFQRQHIIAYSFDATFTKFYIADFYCEELKLIIELDGQIHLELKEQDLIRTEQMIERGYQVLRFTNEEVLYNWDHVLKMIGDFKCAFLTPSLPQERGGRG